MVQVPYGNCFSWLKKSSQTLKEERTLQQPMVNNVEQRDDIVRKGYSFALHSFWNTVFSEKRREFFFYSLFLHFFSSTGKKKT